MPDLTTATAVATAPASRPESAAPVRLLSPRIRSIVLVVVAVVLLALPLYVEASWLTLGFSIAAAAVGAIGLNLLTGTTGQLSLGHAFFLACGALTYAIVSGGMTVSGGQEVIGLGLPAIVGMVAGVVVAGIAGLLFSPLASRLRGIYLGVASIALVVIAQHVLNTAVPLSGGFNGRPSPTFELFGLSFGNDSGIVLLGVPFGRAEMLWYLGLAVLAIGWWFAQNVLNSRSGRAMRIVADNELAASVMGVNVAAYKGKVFFLSSIYAGMGGVLTAISIGSVAPGAFTFEVSLQYLVMIVLGGMGSVGGAVAGAAVVIALPILLQQYASGLPFLNPSGGFTASHLARYIYGGAVVAILLFKPSGLAGMARDTTGWLTRRIHGIRAGGAGKGVNPGDDTPAPGTGTA